MAIEITELKEKTIKELLKENLSSPLVMKILQAIVDNQKRINILEKGMNKNISSMKQQLKRIRR